ncbi:hypothetical protein [Pseudomonas sp. 22 E 5]|nr:hypothetical protein [Pseudomonas sp. 22 E 5]
MGAFVDRVQAVVAVVLLHRVFAGVAVAAEDLDRQFVGLEAELRWPGFDDGREQVEQFVGVLALGFGCQRGGVVKQPSRVQAQVEGAFHIGFLGQQHALDIGVLDDRNRRGARVFAVGQATLRAFAGVFQGIEVAGVTQHHCTHADADACFVHHLEHATQALMGFTHQVADTVAVIAEVKRRGRGAAPAHLVEQPGQQHIIACAQAAVFVDQEFGHDKQRNALHPRRRVRQLGQHHVHDVFRQRVVAAGDEDLVALEPIRAVGRKLGAGANIRQRRTGMRLGEGHGAEEAALDHRLQEALFLFLGAEAFDEVGGAHGQERVGR